MSIGYVTFLMGALIACAFCLVNYIQMQSELTTKITEVSRMGLNQSGDRNITKPKTAIYIRPTD